MGTITPGPPAAAALSRGRAGRADGFPPRGSYGLQLTAGQTFEIEDPADQVCLLADARQAATSKPPQAMPVFAFAEEFLDLLPTALREAVAEAVDAHAD